MIRLSADLLLARKYATELPIAPPPAITTSCGVSSPTAFAAVANANLCADSLLVGEHPSAEYRNDEDEEDSTWDPTQLDTLRRPFMATGTTPSLVQPADTTAGKILCILLLLFAKLEHQSLGQLLLLSCTKTPGRT